MKYKPYGLHLGMIYPNIDKVCLTILLSMRLLYIGQMYFIMSDFYLGNQTSGDAHLHDFDLLSFGGICNTWNLDRATN